MNATAAALSRSWQVGHRIVTLTIPRLDAAGPVVATAEWTPSEPARLTPGEWRQYRFGRNQAIEQLAAELGISVAVLDL
jgi:hypothetical protein